LLQLEKITVSRHAARLERANWLERHDDAQDGRAYRLRLTPRAAKVIAQLSGVSEKLRDDAMAGIADTRRAALIDDLLQIKSTLLSMEADAKSPSRSHEKK
jgi:DNA-binding MarR family transcriptional regulator